MESKHLVYFLEPQPEEPIKQTPEQIMGEAWSELMEQVNEGWWSLEEAVQLFHRTFPSARE